MVAGASHLSEAKIPTSFAFKASTVDFAAESSARTMGRNIQTSIQSPSPQTGSAAGPSFPTAFPRTPYERFELDQITHLATVGKPLDAFMPEEGTFPVFLRGRPDQKRKIYAARLEDANSARISLISKDSEKSAPSGHIGVSRYELTTPAAHKQQHLPMKIVGFDQSTGFPVTNSRAPLPHPYVKTGTNALGIDVAKDGSGIINTAGIDYWIRSLNNAESSSIFEASPFMRYPYSEMDRRDWTPFSILPVEEMKR